MTSPRAGVSTPEQGTRGADNSRRIRQRQRWAEETFWRLVGGKPKVAPLHLQETGGFDRSGYRVRKLVYQSQPELYVAANLYIPAGTPPFPGVLFQTGALAQRQSG